MSKLRKNGIDKILFIFSMDSKKKCRVPGCAGTNTMHCFPKNPEQLQIWVNKMNSEELKNLAPQTLYNNRRVCSAHFKKTDYLKNCGRLLLLKNAIPSLFMPLFSGILSLEEPNLNLKQSTSRENVPVQSTLEKQVILEGIISTNQQEDQPQDFNQGSSSVTPRASTPQPQTVENLMKRILKWKREDVKLDYGAADTAELILFLDELFDSLNSYTHQESLSKLLLK